MQCFFIGWVSEQLLCSDWDNYFSRFMMIFFKKFLNIFLLSTFLCEAVPLKIDEPGSLIEAARHYLQEEEFTSLYGCLNTLGNLDEKIASDVLEAVFKDCCEGKKHNFYAHLDDLINERSEEAYYFSGMLYYLGCSQLKQEKNRVLAAGIFLELAEFLPEAEVKHYSPAIHTLSRMRLDDREKLLIYRLHVKHNGHVHALKLFRTLEAIS